MVLSHDSMVKLGVMVFFHERKKMIIATTGWRHYTDATFIRVQLMRYNSQRMIDNYGPLHVRVGDAAGADSIVVNWCRENGISYQVFYAAWDTDLRAGPERNRRMLKGEGDPVTGPTKLLLAFPRVGGPPIRIPGSGTWGCVIQASQLSIQVEIPPYHSSGE